MGGDAGGEGGQILSIEDDTEVFYIAAVELSVAQEREGSTITLAELDVLWRLIVLLPAQGGLSTSGDLDF